MVKYKYIYNCWWKDQKSFLYSLFSFSIIFFSYLLTVLSYFLCSFSKICIVFILLKFPSIKIIFKKSIDREPQSSSSEVEELTSFSWISLPGKRYIRKKKSMVSVFILNNKVFWVPDILKMSPYPADWLS